METVASLIEQASRLQLQVMESERVLRLAIPFANKRWSDSNRSFMDNLERGQREPHLVNTSTALTTIARCPTAFPGKQLECFLPDGDKEKKIADRLTAPKERLKKICDFYTGPDIYKTPTDRLSVKEAAWHSKDSTVWSPYNTALALQALVISARYNGGGDTFADICDTKDDLSRIMVDETKRLMKYIGEWAKQSYAVKYMRDFDHAFFSYTAIESLEVVRLILNSQIRTRIKTADDKSLQDSDAIDDTSNELLVGANSTYGQALKGVISRFHLEFFRQMTFKFANTPQYLDVSTLVLSLFTITRYADFDKKLPDDIVDAALDAIFELQQSGGFWDTGTPLLGSATGLVGCSSIELANCLLRIPRTIVNFDRYSAHFDRILTRIVKGLDQRVPEDGWPTEIKRNGDARQTWYGFLVFEFLTLLSKAFEKHIATLLLRSFKYGKPEPKVQWEQLADFRNFKKRIEDELLPPWQNGEEKHGHKCSFILFGPPGTGKTSIASALAHKLNWGLIEIGPGDFLANGIDGLFAQGDAIFQRLLMLDKVVVLFDEIDELVVSRETQSGGQPAKLDRFVTTYMLPWLQRLRDKGSLIFIFATNHIERFDPAIRRPGRFDMLLPVGPPQGEERVRILIENGLSDSLAKELADEIVPQATYGEMRAAVVKHRSLSEVEKKAAILKQLSAEKLLVKADAWSEFISQCGEYE